MNFEIKDYLLKNGYETEFDNWTEFFKDTDVSSVENVMADSLIKAELEITDDFLSEHEIFLDDGFDYKLEVKADDWNNTYTYEVTLISTDKTSGDDYEQTVSVDSEEAEYIYEALSETISKDLEGYMKERTAIVSKDDKYINAVYPIAFMLSCEYLNDDVSINYYSDYHINYIQHDFTTLTDLIGQTAAIAESVETQVEGRNHYADKLQMMMDKAGLRWEEVLMCKAEHFIEGCEVREDFEEALNNTPANEIQTLSYKIDFGFKDEDISNLAILHKNGSAELKDKIELLLTDCNAHTICNNFAEGNYDKYIIQDHNAEIGVSDIEAQDNVSDRKVPKAAAENSFHLKNASEGYWITNEGTKLSMKDMSEKHIKNCINMLEQRPKDIIYTAYIKAFKKELKNREKNMEK